MPFLVLEKHDKQPIDLKGWSVPVKIAKSRKPKISVPKFTHENPFDELSGECMSFEPFVQPIVVDDSEIKSQTKINF